VVWALVVGIVIMILSFGCCALEQQRKEHITDATNFPVTDPTTPFIEENNL
jgi:hypothetical protein